jgi:organic hydroperoxide reductase OsmC/OhrA
MARSTEPRQHDYTPLVRWTGDKGQGTKTYLGYARTWNIEAPGKAIVACSNDPLLGGDPTKYNPEDLLLSSLSACHMLWYLHLASNAKIVVRGYVDAPVGVGETSPNGAGRFLSATLRPTITVERGADLKRAEAIHHEIHEFCFIARSVNFPVRYEGVFVEV